MFATLLGTLPRPPLDPDATAEALVDAAIETQLDAGLEPLTDGGWWVDRDVVDAWRATADRSGRAVKAVIAGPCSSTAGGPRDGLSAGEAGRSAMLATARATNRVVRDLADAGCQLIEIHEPAVATFGSDEERWTWFREAHGVLTEGITDSHLSLAVTGGSVDRAGIAAVLDLPYASLAVDLIAGPENWRLVRAAPGSRGIVCGALSALAGSDDGPETLLWAAAYASSGSGRGADRVGLATASSLAGLPWLVAVEKLRRLGEAVRLAGLEPAALREAVDPRAVDSRSAALGSAAPKPRSGRTT